MLAAVYHDLNDLRLEQVADPACDPDSAIVRIEAVAICGSDLRIVRHGNPRVRPGAIPGHEASGRVVEVGRNVRGLGVGDRVAIGADVPCGRCRWCRDGKGNNCAINYAVGYQIPGAFADYMRLDRLLLEGGPVARIPDHLDHAAAALAEPLACAINGFELVGMGLGRSVVIMGAGPIGCMMIDLARRMGAARVIVVQRSAARLALAAGYQPDALIASGEGGVVERCRELTGGEGPDVVITSAGSVETHEQAIAMVAHRGHVNLFGGLPKGERPLSVLSNVIHYKECFVTGSHGSTPRQHALAVDLLAAGTVRTAPLITHRLPLAQLHRGLEALERREAMKVVITPAAA
jgi:L-iditol 2-dehydrogenase